MSSRIYLDYNATAPPRAEALRAMAEAAERAWGNPSSAYAEGRQAKTVLETARARVAAAVGADPSEIVFTGGGTEADNLAFWGAGAAREGATPHAVVTAIEHHAVLLAARAAQARGWRLTTVGCDAGGRTDAEDVARALEEDVALVSVMHVNNEVGTIQPIRAIAERVRCTRARFHCDAVQSLGKIPVRVDELGVDLLSLSAHKIGGPKGIGALYIRRGVTLTPLLQGGRQEADRRPGTENVAAAAGFAAAIEWATAGQAREAERLGRLRARLWEGLELQVGGVRFNGDWEQSVTNTLNVSFEGVPGETAMMALDLEGVAVSTGAACTVGAVEPSHVLAAMCFGRDRCQSALRFSLGHGTTEREIEEAVAVVAAVMRRLRAGAS